MTFFFFVVGLEARREFDLGELRERRRFALPLLAGLGGMAVPDRDLSRDQRRRTRRRTAGERRCRPTPRSRSGRSRSSGRSSRPSARVHADGRRRRRRRRAGRDRDGVHRAASTVVPLVVAIGLLARHARGRASSACGEGSSTPLSARRCGSRSSSRASTPWSSASSFGLADVRVPGRPRRSRARDRPVPAVPRAADARARALRLSVGLESAISPNERLQHLYHPWSSYVIVPLFALANAGIPIDAGFLEPRVHLARDARHPRRRTSLGKPVGIVGALVARHAAQPRPAAAAGRLGGARRRRRGRRHRLHRLAADREPRVPRRRSSQEAKLGVLSAAVCAALLSWLVFRATAQLPPTLRARLLVGPAEAHRRPLRRRRPGARPHPRARGRARHARRVRRLRVPVLRPGRRRRSASCSPTSATSATSGATCRSPTCTRTRRSPPRRRRPRPSRARFWEMHDLLFEHQDALRPRDLVRYARAARPRRRPLRATSCARTTHAGARRRRRRQRRSQRRLRHADVLRQRPAPLRRLRHRRA